MTTGNIPLRKINLGPHGTTVTHRADGAILMRSPHALQAYPRALTERLVYWAAQAPDRPMFGQRDAKRDWRVITYAQVMSAVRSIGQALLKRGLSSERPVAILSGNEIEHALLALAAMHVGVPYTAISPAYSLISTDYGKLKTILSLLTPGLIYASHGEVFARALDAAAPADAELVVNINPPKGRKATLFSDLTSATPTAEVDRAFAAVGPDTIAKFLFTSGSTGAPKGVINTQRILCSNMQMVYQCLPFLANTPPVIVDWSPWNHTAGGNNNFNNTVFHGGTCYIDDGRPVPGQFERTIENLRDVSPTVHWGIPKSYEMLLPYLEQDKKLRETFYAKLQMLFYASASLSQPLWDGLTRLAVETIGARVIFITGLGSTETGPFAICANWEDGRAGLVGLSVPGVDLKLAPVGNKLEARVKGPNITPGYWRQPETTRAAFDDEGYYKMGDALHFADPQHPEKGLLFGGRIGENFKLSSGTWVTVGTLRTAVLAAGTPVVQDVVFAGHDRDDLTVMIFPSVAACRALCHDLAADAPIPAVLHSKPVRARFQAILDQLIQESTGSATRIARALLLEVPPAIDAHEITDKGSINQRAVLDNRPALVAELYAEPYSERVLIAQRKIAVNVA
jgi:feruloyl-CoA synthase